MVKSAEIAPAKVNVRDITVEQLLCSFFLSMNAEMMAAAYCHGRIAQILLDHPPYADTMPDTDAFLAELKRQHGALR